MTIKLELAYGIIEAITDLRKGDDLEDFTVIVDGVIVRCHKFILGACSLFFRALFRSGMKEDVENCVTLKTVSYQTFTLILSALYTSCDILTEENVVDVWRATHMLEIGFLVRECENFVEQNISIDNFEKIYEAARFLDSTRILKIEHEFMTNNFDLIRTSQTLLKLSYSEINVLVETDELATSTEDNVVESILQWVSYVSPKTREQINDNEVEHNMRGLAVQTEDEDQENQINTSDLSEQESVNLTHGKKDSETNEVGDENDDLNNTSDEDTWGMNTLSLDTETQNLAQDKMAIANEAAIQTLAPLHKQTHTLMLLDGRQQHLLSLLSSARCCLLSPEYLEQLLSNPIIIDNSEFRGIVLKAVNYQLQTGYRHGQWPSAAIHRSNSPLTNVLVWSRINDYHRCYRSNPINVRAFFSKDIKRQLTTSASSGKLTAFDNELYELNGEGLHVFRDNSWRQIIDCRLSAETFIIPLRNYIYFLDGSTNELKAVDPKEKFPVMQDQLAFPGESNITGATRFHDRILVFSSLVNEENELETAVHCFSPSKKSWERLENLKGPANNLISFHNDDDTFLLQTNGSLWKVTDESDVSIKIVFCKKAWDFHYDLYGAAIFRKKLVIFGGQKPKGKKISFLLPGSKALSYTINVNYTICTTSIILPRKYLKKFESQHF